MLEKKPESEAGAAEAAPHYHGHRERLRARFREAGADALSDYELCRRRRAGSCAAR
jgi:DNA repair protein RadC